jgi:hypothetical protein
MGKMAEILKKMPQYVQSKDKYSLHMETVM